ncbi:MAG: AAA family ATPase [Ruegeria sp.]|nr:AAA family ATPase [Ruegeria sp.]
MSDLSVNPSPEQDRSPEHKHRAPTPFEWRDPATIPPRQWLYGEHLIRKQVSATVAAGGVGKSSHSIVEALAMVTGRELLGERVPKPLRIWIYNLEDPLEEMERRVSATMMHHGIEAEELGDRLFLNTGRERPLCTAVRGRDGIQILTPVVEELARLIRRHKIDVVIIDPFISSHQVEENDNGAIDLVVKAWAKLADDCNCAVELVHHTRKANGEASTSESSRGASAFLAAARSGRVFNKMSEGDRAKAGLENDHHSYFSIDRDKANFAPSGQRIWRRMVAVDLPNGDSVGVAETWEWPSRLDDIAAESLLAVQKAIDGKFPRYSDQSGEAWVGMIVAEVLELDPVADRKRIKMFIENWIKDGALKKVDRMDDNRRNRPCIEVGEWVPET